MGLGINETAINRTEGYSYGDYVFPIDATYGTIDGTMASLYRYGLSEHGRCTGKVYIDTDDGTKHIGYCFLKRKEYDNCDVTYLCETWLTMGEYHPATPERITHG